MFRLLFGMIRIIRQELREEAFAGANGLRVGALVSKAWKQTAQHSVLCAGAPCKRAIPVDRTKPRIRAHLAPFLHVSDFGHLRFSKLPRPRI